MKRVFLITTLILSACSEGVGAKSSVKNMPLSLEMMHMPDEGVKCGFYPASYKFSPLDKESWKFLVALDPEDEEKKTIFVRVDGENRVLKHVKTDRDRLIFQSHSGDPLKVVLSIIPDLDLQALSPEMLQDFSNQGFRPFVGQVDVSVASQGQPIIIKGFC